MWHEIGVIGLSAVGGICLIFIFEVNDTRVVFILFVLALVFIIGAWNLESSFVSDTRKQAISFAPAQIESPDMRLAPATGYQVLHSDVLGDSQVVEVRKIGAPTIQVVRVPKKVSFPPFFTMLGAQPTALSLSATPANNPAH